MNLIVPILAFALTAGQLIRVPLGGQGAITILDITVFLFCMGALINLRFRIKKPPQYILAAVIFIAVAALSLIFTPLKLSRPEYLTSFFYILRFALYIFLGWLLYANAFNLGKGTTKALLISGISFAVLGLLQFIFFPNLDFLQTAGWDPHYFRTVSTFLDPNFAGGFLVLTLIIILSLRNEPIMTPRVFGTLFFIVYLTLLTTFSRSGYLMFLVSGMTLSFFKRSRIYFASTLVLFITLLLGFQIYTQLVTKPLNIDRTQSASSRLDTWQQGLAIFQKSPLLGVGFNAYRYALKEYKLGDEQFLASHGSSGNDSSLLFVLSTTGIAGFLAYLYFLWSLVKSSGGGNIILIVVVAGLLIHSLFANSLFYPPVLAWILIIAAAPKK
ncbi:O-antigen ligase family protein [Candidatus Daviesbacteria bacterium]|nr:O-antigen ligase family protein [Candidatus Daviesbacteria bacterium]